METDYDDDFFVEDTSVESFVDISSKPSELKKPARSNKRKATTYSIIEKERWLPYIEKNPTLDEVYSVVRQLMNTTSGNAKLEILSKNIHVCKFWLYVYHPFWHYQLTAERLKKEITEKKGLDLAYSSSVVKNSNGEIYPFPKNIFELLDLLRDRKITGDAAKEATLEFISQNRKHVSFIPMILDKNLKIGCNVKKFNSVFVDLIPEFDVALAMDFQKYQEKFNLNSQKWLISRKYDGVRVLCFCNGASIDFRSREGNPFTSLKALEHVLVTAGWNNVVLDTEVCKIDGSGKEDFKDIQSSIKRKGYTIPFPHAIIFDVLTVEEFWAKSTITDYSTRYSKLKEMAKDASAKDKNFDLYFSVIEQETVTSMDDIDRWNKKSEANSWEGTMLRRDVPYVGKRSFDILKIKKVYDEEFKCVRVDTGMMKVQRDGKETFIKTMTNIIVDIGDSNECSVGTGFNDEERNLYCEKPELIVGKMITVKYWEKTTNKNGGKGLRFPSFKCIRDEQ